jgi:hypothetical protein
MYLSYLLITTFSKETGSCKMRPKFLHFPSGLELFMDIALIEPNNNVRRGYQLKNLMHPCRCIYLIS